MRPAAGILTLALLAVACSGGDAEEVGPTPEITGAVTSATPEALRLSQPRAVHRATRLTDGSVLLTGGCTRAGCGGFDEGRTAEVYADGELHPGARMVAARASGTATLLADGRVLLTGGYPGEGGAPTAAAEVYDPGTGRFAAVGDLVTGRADHSATRLPDGTVLVAGGFDARGRALSSSEIYDPATEVFAAGPELGDPRAAHVAVALEGGVLVVGGTAASAAIATTEVWRGGRWRPGPTLLTPRVKLGAVALVDGRVLVAGGATDTEGRERLDTTELVDVVDGDVAAGPSMTAGEYKLDGALAVLSDGRVVLPSAGGLDVFDPAGDSITALPGTTYAAASFRTVTAVGPRQVLVAGGYDERISPTDQAVLVRVPPRAMR